ncbi:MAG TPA: amidase family protein [Opitutaceae bacterium]|nr:amidase family protein [Opitutaceae bacterium]
MIRAVANGENTLSYWRHLARERAAAAEFAVRLSATPSAVRSTAIAWVAPDLEAAWSAAVPGPLHGVPLLVKDLYDLAGVPTRAGSTFLERERPVPVADSALVRSFRELGAVPIAKTQLNEFAYGATGENAHSGDCFQLPHPDRLTGGSSSGSAWGAQAGIAPLALGTDTGCSVRVPASFCGLWGVRLAPAHWSITDVFPLARSFDSAGWFTANAADMAETIALILGEAPATPVREGAWISLADLGENEPDMDAALATAASGIARPASPRVLRLVREAVERSLAAYTVIVAREALAVHRPFLEQHSTEYDPVVHARLKRAMEFTDSDEAAARATMSAVGALLRDAIAGAGFIVLPVSPMPALTKAQSDDANRTRILRLNTPASLAGLPALTIPVPLPDGLSGGLQVIFASMESAAPMSVLSALA